MSHYKKFVKDTGFVGLAQILTNVAGIVLLPILTKSLNPELYGIWAQISATLFFLAPLILWGLTNAIIRFIPAATDLSKIRSQVWSTTVFVWISACISAMLLIFLREYIGHILQIPPLFVIALAVLIVFETSARLFLSLLQAFQRMQAYSFFTVMVSLGELLFIGIAIARGYQLLGVLLAVVAVRILTAFTMAFLIVKQIGISRPSFSPLPPYLKYSIPTLLSAFAYQGINLTNQYLIGIFLGIAYVGYYAPAYSFSALLSMVYISLSTVLPPLLAQLFAQKKIKEVRTYLAHTLLYVLFLLIPSVFGFLVLSRQLLEIFSTKEIAQHSVWVLPLIGGSFLLYGAYTIFVQVLTLFLKTNYIGALWVGAALLNFTLNIFLIPRLGIVGTGIATLISFAFALGATWVIAWRYLVFPVPWKQIFKSVAASSLMALSIKIIDPAGLIPTLLAVAVGTLFYFSLMFLLKGVGKKEIEFLTQLFAKA